MQWVMHRKRKENRPWLTSSGSRRIGRGGLVTRRYRHSHPRDRGTGAKRRNLNFFDLLVLHDRLPAFNYPDTFDAALEFRDRLGDVLNVGGDKTLVHVDVEHHMYREAKTAALDQLSHAWTRDRS